MLASYVVVGLAFAVIAIIAVLGTALVVWAWRRLR